MPHVDLLASRQSAISHRHPSTSPWTPPRTSDYAQGDVPTTTTTAPRSLGCGQSSCSQTSRTKGNHRASAAVFVKNHEHPTLTTRPAQRGTCCLLQLGARSCLRASCSHNQRWRCLFQLTTTRPTRLVRSKRATRPISQSHQGCQLLAKLDAPAFRLAFLAIDFHEVRALDVEHVLVPDDVD